MADFKTHMYVASPLSGLAASSLLVAGMANPGEVVLYFALGCIGSMLPDIDSDNSVPVRLAFNFMAPLIILLLIFSKGFSWSLVELFIIWLASFALIKYIAFSFFTRLTVHRGVIHSIPAAFFFWFLSTILFYRVFHFSSFAAWLAGLFVFAGFIVHLVLDELNSLNLFGGRVKKSLGSALALVKFNDLGTTFLLYASVMGLFTLTPDPLPFFNRVTNRNVYRQVHVLPRGDWFQDLWKNLAQPRR